MTASTPQLVRCYLNGEWVNSDATRGQDVINPATGETLAKVPFCSADDVNTAVEAAQASFPQWRGTPPIERIQPLFRLKRLVEDRFDQLAETITLENGKTLAESRGELQRTIENIEVATGAPSLMQGAVLEDIAPGIDESAIRQPLGVFACIAPFNFPAMIPAWFAPYALATGNTYIVKPSEQTPLTQQLMFELIDEAGFPPGVVNLVHGDKATVDALLDHPDIAGISFVGSTPVAQAVYERATANGKRAQCHGGAKNFLVIMPDADLDATVEAVANSAYGCAGQRCLAGSAAVTVGGTHDTFLDRLSDNAQAIRVGNGLNEATDMGPVISDASRRRILDALSRGERDGVQFRLDGRSSVQEDSAGYFVGPTVVEGVDPDSTLANEEIFGPVLTTLHTDSLDEALEVIERNPFGNAASIFTQDGSAARKFKHRVPCGNVGINVGVAAPMAFFPFSGMKASFFGDLHGQGRDAIRFFTDTKVVIERW